MAKKSMILKQQAPAKFSTRKYNRCKLCGRPHAYLRDYGVCRICFRTLAYKGEIPGVRKAVASPPRLTKKFKIFPPYFVGPARRTQSTPSPCRLVWRKNLSSVSAIPGRSDTASPGLTKNNSFQRGPRPLVYRMAKGHW